MNIGDPAVYLKFLMSTLFKPAREGKVIFNKIGLFWHFRKSTIVLLQGG